MADRVLALERVIVFLSFPLKAAISDPSGVLEHWGRRLRGKREGDGSGKFLLVW